MKTFIGLLAALFFTSVAIAQPDKEKWSVGGEVMLPSGQANKAYKSYMAGLLVAGPKLTYSINKHFFASIGARYMYCNVSEFKTPQKMNGGLHMVGGHLELGYKAWQGPRFGIEFGVKVGAANYHYSTRTIIKDKFSNNITVLERFNNNVNAMYYEPNVQFVLLADEAVAYRWIMGYNFAGYAFRPDMIGATGGGYKPDDLKASTQAIVVGFGITLYLGNKRSDTDIMDFSQ